MTKSEIFTKAHALVKSTGKGNGSYKEAFSTCLKKVYASIPVEIIDSEKSGTRHFITVSNIKKEAFESMLETHRPNGITVSSSNNKLGYVVRCENKAARQELDLFIFKINRDRKIVVKEEAPQKPVRTERYIASLEYAQVNNLSHGKAWVCTEWHIETKGVNPCHEGEFICYVYPQ